MIFNFAIFPTIGIIYKLCFYSTTLQSHFSKAKRPHGQVVYVKVKGYKLISSP